MRGVSVFLSRDVGREKSGQSAPVRAFRNSEKVEYGRQSTGPIKPADRGRRQFEQVASRASSCVNQALNFGASKGVNPKRVNQKVGLPQSRLENFTGGKRNRI